jgi:ketopantoate reductase
MGLSGCTSRPDIISASFHEIGSRDTEVGVLVRSRDAHAIKSKQLYFSINIYDCKNQADRFPAEPFIAGQRASSFNFPVVGTNTLITGTVPSSIFKRFSKHCLFLEGGGYLSGKLESNSVVMHNK